MKVEIGKLLAILLLIAILVVVNYHIAYWVYTHTEFFWGIVSWCGVGFVWTLLIKGLLK